MFNNACITRLEEVVYIQVLINPATKKLVIRPCGEGARDAIRWCIAKDEKRKTRQISCKPFADKLYEMMGWETLYRYKLQGSKINFQGEELYVFDLTSRKSPARRERTMAIQGPGETLKGAVSDRTGTLRSAWKRPITPRLCG